MHSSALKSLNWAGYAIAFLAGAAFIFAFDRTLPSISLTPERIAINKANEAKLIEMVCRGDIQGPPAYSEELCGKR
jgi:hypothetical protein